MAIRWINNYHRGFNRLWLVLSCLVALPVCLYQISEARFQYKRAIAPRLTIGPPLAPDSYRKERNKPPPAPPKVKAWVKTKAFIKAGWRVVRYSLGTVIIAFGFGHCGFLVVYWIIRGFRKG